MKIKKKLFIAFLVTIITVLQPLAVMADSSTSLNVSREYLSDGSYFETIIESNSNLKKKKKNATKTTTYKNSNGESLWYAKVTASFYYDGGTSSCTSSSASGGSYVSTWKILSKSSSRTGNVGSATVTAGSYYVGILIGTITETVTLACDKNGNLS